MKLNTQDIDFFRTISGTDVGRYFADYVKRVVDYAYDSRSWKEGDTKESADHAARLMRELIVEKIRPSEKSPSTTGPFE